MTSHYISWWNLENLFDVKDAPTSRRPDDLARKIKADLKNWTSDVLTKKIEKLAWVISQMNASTGPDIMGVCEVENAHVLQLLLDALNTNRNYGLIHHDMGDKRGIDVAFIYDKDKFDFNTDEFFHHTVVKRYPTREIVQATVVNKSSGNEIVLIGNHWPSRSAGQYESEPYRIITGETLSYFIERIQEIKGDDAAIVVMGDFNDDPYNRSLTDYALSVMDRDKVVYGRNPYLYNMMWPLLGQRKASYVYGGVPMMIDQFMVSKGIAKKSGKFSLDEKKVKLEIFEGMVSGRYDTPVRFGQEKPDFDGFSDHLPISFVLDEK
ncbi:endonuclease/exonuclease/phosphatase family protein [Ekhidna sp.]|jgi:endonuclease/exonuclease/phosphatase family metal-dependent hydrolase|uniref:endonuclease/exonuclease/phosphatase family protein n=1 Tax=Ekhidna sp. TaxID=2608089 RepID=UPI0032EBABBA